MEEPSDDHASVVSGARHVLEPPTPFGRSLLWRLQRASYQAQGPLAWRPGGVPLQVTSNPFIARCYAAVIAGLVRDLRAAGLLRRPLRIVELGAGSGRFGFYLLDALATAFARDRDAPYRVILTDVAERNVLAWAAHPRLAPFLEAGVCDLARLDVEDPTPFALRVSGETVGPDDGGEPVVAIANYLFDSVPVEAWRVEGGVLRECLVALDGPMTRELALLDPAAAIESIAWTLSAGEAWRDGDPVKDAIARETIAAGDGRVLLWPGAGLRALDFLAGAGGGRLLALTSDKGHREAALLPRRADLGLVRHGGCVSLPVDFHALARAVELRGGFAVPEAQRHDRFYSGVLALGLDPATLPRCLDAVEEMERFGPGDYQRLVDHTAAGPAPALEHALTLLRLGGFDPRLVARLADAMTAAVKERRGDWLERDLAHVLERARELCYPLAGQRDGILVAIGTLMFHLGRPARAVVCLEESLDGTVADAPTHVRLALCWAQLGRRDEAQAAIERALALAPESGEARRVAAWLDGAVGAGGVIAQQGPGDGR